MTQKNYILLAKSAIWLLGLVGINPVEFIEHSTGLWALVFLLLSLTMTPIRLITGVVWQIQLRRLLGLWMFFFACLHIITYVWLDFAFLWDEILIDVFDHPRILIGFAAFLLAIPLAFTSNSYMVKKLKTKWKTLHQLVYPLAILAVLHFLLLVKRDLTEPIYYAVVLVLLLGVRVYFHIKKKKTVMN